MNRLKKEIMMAAVDDINCDASQIVTRRYRFAESFCGFSGHFTGFPILPAIVQLLTFISLVETHSGRRQRLLCVEDAKFLAPVRPDEEIHIRYRQRTIGGKQLHEAKLTVADKTAAKFSLLLAAEDEP